MRWNANNNNQNQHFSCTETSSSLKALSKAVLTSSCKLSFESPACCPCTANLSAHGWGVSAFPIQGASAGQFCSMEEKVLFPLQDECQCRDGGPGPLCVSCFCQKGTVWSSWDSQSQWDFLVDLNLFVSSFRNMCTSSCTSLPGAERWKGICKG